jgi:hypothetical protein
VRSSTFDEVADHWLTPNEANMSIVPNNARAERDSLAYARRDVGDDIWTPDQMTKFLDHVAGLRSSNIDLDASTLRIRQARVDVNRRDTIVATKTQAQRATCRSRHISWRWSRPC